MIGRHTCLVGSSKRTASLRRASESTTRRTAIYNPDQQYQAHILHLEELSVQAEQHLRIATLSQHRHVRGSAAGRWLGVVLARLGRKPDGWGSAVAMPSLACRNTGGVCDADGNQFCAGCT
jgi:hypothetical protein